MAATFVCVICGDESEPHDRDGMQECKHCARKPCLPAWEAGRRKEITD